MNDAIRLTHEVTNQVPPLEGYDAWSANPWLREATARAGAAAVEAAAVEMGRYVGSAEAQHHARLANRYTPELHSHDRAGNRIDQVEYHPSYHVLMRKACAAGLHASAWKGGDAPFARRAALFYLWNQLEQGTSCPVTMTFASMPVFEHAPELMREWRPRVLADSYDPRPLPAGRKTGAMVGMAMTEKQGGSDLRAVQTQARREAGAWRLTGHKWFCSAPMSDAFFTLARTPEGVSCFFLPRWLPDGGANPFLIQRLKEKCGNQSNASAEVEFADTLAWAVGEPGRGIATILNMAHHTRFDIVVALAGMMRAALDQAVHHASHRAAFGKRLVEHALMANVLADLALEAEAAMLLAFRLAQAFDGGARGDAREGELQRLLTPVAKYWLCKQMTPVATEAMECLGGNGYVEEGPLARLYREAPLNGIWEGSANVICLDALRALSRSPDSLSVLLDEIAAARDPRLDRAARRAGTMLADRATAETNARTVARTLALCTQASLMRRFSSDVAAEAFCVSRLESPSGGFGTLALDAQALEALVARARLRA